MRDRTYDDKEESKIGEGKLNVRDTTNLCIIYLSRGHNEA